MKEGERASCKERIKELPSKAGHTNGFQPHDSLAITTHVHKHSYTNQLQRLLHDSVANTTRERANRGMTTNKLHVARQHNPRRPADGQTETERQRQRDGEGRGQTLGGLFVWVGAA